MPGFSESSIEEESKHDYNHHASIGEDFQQKTMSDVHGDFNNIDFDSVDQKIEIDIVDEELQKIEFESLNKSTHIGSILVPPLRLPLPSKNYYPAPKVNK